MTATLLAGLQLSPPPPSLSSTRQGSTPSPRSGHVTLCSGAVASHLMPTKDPREPRRPGCCHPLTCPHCSLTSSLSTFPLLKPLSSLSGLCCSWNIPGVLSPLPGMLFAQVSHSHPITTSVLFPPIDTGCLSRCGLSILKREKWHGWIFCSQTS